MSSQDPLRSGADEHTGDGGQRAETAHSGSTQSGPSTQPELVTRALGRQVISTDDASTLGSVKAILLDVTGRHIEALHVSGRARRAELLSWADVTVFGPDAVIARAGASLQAVADDQQQEMVRGRINVIGGRVLGTDGFERGHVEDVAFDASSGDVISLAASGRRIPASAVRSLGHYCWVVDESVPVG